jgi:hypothetical protein
MRKLPLLLLSLAIVSCVYREKPHPASNESGDFDSLSIITQKVTAIPLETNAQCKLSEIRRVKTAPSGIFIQSENELYRFDPSGLFLNKISLSGDARINKYAINADAQHIIVLDSLSMLHYYTYDGALLFTQDAEAGLPGQTILDLAYHNHYLWVVTNRVAANNAIEKWICKLDISFNHLEGAKLDTVNLGRFYLDGSFTSELYVSDKMIYVYSPFSYKETILQDTLHILSSGQLRHEQMYPHKGWADFPAYTVPFIMGSRYLVASYQANVSEAANYLLCFDTKTYQSFGMNGFNDDFFHTGIVKNLLPYNTNNQEYYFCKSGKDVSASFPERDENANPVLFVVRLNG